MTDNTIHGYGPMPPDAPPAKARLHDLPARPIPPSEARARRLHPSSKNRPPVHITTPKGVTP